jgi:hypothetical protein
MGMTYFTGISIGIDIDRPHVMVVSPVECGVEALALAREARNPIAMVAAIKEKGHSQWQAR